MKKESNLNKKCRHIIVKTHDFRKKLIWQEAKKRSECLTSLRASSVTFAPILASSIAKAFPIPLDPPVIYKHGFIYQIFPRKHLNISQLVPKHDILKSYFTIKNLSKLSNKSCN